jgi:hypothetical protein
MRDTDWKARTLLERALLRWHKAMPHDLRGDFIYAIQRFGDLTTYQVDRWALFAGSGISQKCCEAVGRVWKALYGINISFGDKLAAETSLAVVFKSHADVIQ